MGEIARTLFAYSSSASWCTIERISGEPSILIVDDDDVLRDRLGRAFRARGFDTRTARNYDEALRAARDESPEMAIVDLKMPGRSGLEVVRDLVAIDPQTRVVVLTGYGSIATTIDAMKLGAVYYLPKPADVDDILAAFLRGGDTAHDQWPAEEFSPPSLERLKWEHINIVMADCEGNISEAARRLKMHRRTLQRVLQKHPPRA